MAITALWCPDLFCNGGKMAHPTGFEPVASTFGGWRSIQLSYGCIDIQIVSEIKQGQSQNWVIDAADSQRAKPRQSSPFVLYNLLPVCFRGASVTSQAAFLFQPSSANTLVSLDFFHTRASQKELAYAFGGQRSIQLSYGCLGNDEPRSAPSITQAAVPGNAEFPAERPQRLGDGTCRRSAEMAAQVSVCASDSFKSKAIFRA
jgi:hypothetical protein